MERRYECTHPGCNKAYSKPSRLEEHQRSHTGERPFVCTECQKSYLRETHLQAHSRSHLPPSARPLECPEIDCKKRFWTAQHLQKHIDMHNGIKPLTCQEPDCDQAFAKQYQLRAHVCTSHASEGTKSFQCDHPGCSKSFSTRQHLRSHSKVHDDKRYTCSRQECLPTTNEPPTYFSTWTALQRHLRSVHPPACTDPECNGRIFASNKGLREHEKIHEQYGRDWKCVDCGKELKSKKALNVHTKIVHLGRRDYVCSEENCDRTFGYRHLLRRHQARCHLPPSFSSDTPGDQADLIAGEAPTHTSKRRQIAHMAIDNITGKAYETQAERQLQCAKAFQCPYPHLSELVTADSSMDAVGSSECRYVFSRGYDLWRHLRTTHDVEAERDQVDQWVKRSRGSVDV